MLIKDNFNHHERMRDEDTDAYFPYESNEAKSMTMPTEDVVNNPSHYNQSGVECIDAIEACTDEGFEYYLQGNILKYIWRYRYKNGVEDLKKARWYLDKLIEVRDT
jgi:hypothetical protein